jgi:hypothetical protein
MTPTGPALAALAEPLTDLAAAADREGARAADVDVALSSALFILGDELRSMAARTSTDGDLEEAYALLDDARTTVARTMVRLDVRERMSATPAPGSVYDVGGFDDSHLVGAAAGL